MTSPFLRFTMLPTAGWNARGLRQNRPGMGRLQRHFPIGDGRPFRHKPPNHLRVLFVKVNELGLSGLSIGKAGGVAETEAEKERGVAPILQTVVPIGAVAHDVNDGEPRVTFVNGIQAVDGRKVALFPDIVVVL